MSHAGLEEGEFRILAFKDEHLLEILQELGIEKDDIEDHLLIDGKQIECEFCKTPIFHSNISAILPGSKIIVCDDLSCLSEYISRYIRLACTNGI